MVHSGAVVATTLSSTSTRNDVQKRDFVACGAAAGVWTAFSAPIGGILFALEEGTSYWGPSLTWRAFFCSMIALTSLYVLNTIGSAFGKVGFNKLFSFGNFVFDEGGETSYYVYELFLFIAIGVIGGIIGAVFNDTNERITKWRLRNVNHSKSRRFVEVMLVSLLVSTVSFLLPLIWGLIHGCTPLPEDENYSRSEIELLENMVPFRCVPGKEYNEMATLIFTDAGDAIRQLFHLHKHAFSAWALFFFFIFYISLAVLVYGKPRSRISLGSAHAQHSLLPPIQQESLSHQDYLFLAFCRALPLDAYLVIWRSDCIRIWLSVTHTRSLGLRLCWVAWRE